jgi:hypothetical protein
MYRISCLTTHRPQTVGELATHRAISPQLAEYLESDTKTGLKV